MTTTKSYDYLNRLTSISSVNASSVVLDSHAYAYNNANQRTAVTNTDSSRWSFGYDSLGQVISGDKYWSDGSVVAGQQFGYAFDDIGNRTTTSAGGDQWGANLRYANYTANNLNQCISRTVPGAVDIIGIATNTATATVNNQPTYRKGTYYRTQLPLTNNAASVYQSVTNLAVQNVGTNQDVIASNTGSIFLPQTPESFTYDADGNLTQDGRWTYTWDAENRLINITSLSGAPTASKLKLDFTYDWKSRRTQKLVSTNTGSYVASYTNSFAYDGWNLTTELNEASGALIHNYVWGSDLSGSMQGAGGVGGLLTVSSSSAVVFTCYDGNGNIMALIDTTNSAIDGQYEYGPFGEVIRASGPMAKLNPFRFSTKYQDDETDLVYYGYRYYNASTGKWPNRDPIEEEGGINLYGFLSNDGINAVDYLGLCAPCCCCAEDIKIENIKQIEDKAKGLFGHSFDTVISLKYVSHKEEKDCKLKWLERTNRGYTTEMRKKNNEWYDMTQDPETKGSFDNSWGKRKKPCPGSETVRDTDPPQASVTLPARTLEFRIIVESADGCPCAKKSVEITAKQTLDPTKTPRTQDFVTPAP